jgi:hypothetical protein
MARAARLLSRHLDRADRQRRTSAPPCTRSSASTRPTIALVILALCAGRSESTARGVRHLGRRARQPLGVAHGCFPRKRSSACRCRVDAGGSRLRPEAIAGRTCSRLRTTLPLSRRTGREISRRPVRTALLLPRRRHQKRKSMACDRVGRQWGNDRSGRRECRDSS